MSEDTPALGPEVWALATFAETLPRYRELQVHDDADTAEVQEMAILGVEKLLFLGLPLQAAALAVISEAAFRLDRQTWPWSPKP